MRVMALDIGDVRVGIAISDPDGRVATPLCVLPTSEVMSSAASFKRVLEDWEPEYFLFGAPLTLAGQNGKQASHIKLMAEQIADRCGLEYGFADERLSSSQAKKSMRESGLSEKEMRGKVDMVAASLFLQAWLDARPERI